MLTVSTALFRAHRSSVNRSLSDAPDEGCIGERGGTSAFSLPLVLLHLTIIFSVGLVEEFSARVLAEQSFSDSRGGSFLEELQPSLEGIVDIDLAAAADDDDTSGSVTNNS